MLRNKLHQFIHWAWGGVLVDLTYTRGTKKTRVVRCLPLEVYASICKRVQQTNEELEWYDE